MQQKTRKTDKESFFSLSEKSFNHLVFLCRSLSDHKNEEIMLKKLIGLASTKEKNGLGHIPQFII